MLSQVSLSPLGIITRYCSSPAAFLVESSSTMLVMQIHCPPDKKIQVQSKSESILHPLHSVFYNDRVSLTPGSEIGKEEMSDFAFLSKERSLYSSWCLRIPTLTATFPTSQPAMMPHMSASQRWHILVGLFYQCPLF